MVKKECTTKCFFVFFFNPSNACTIKIKALKHLCKCKGCKEKRIKWFVMQVKRTTFLPGLSYIHLQSINLLLLFLVMYTLVITMYTLLITYAFTFTFRNSSKKYY